MANTPVRITNRTFRRTIRNHLPSSLRLTAIRNLGHLTNHLNRSQVNNRNINRTRLTIRQNIIRRHNRFTLGPLQIRMRRTMNRAIFNQHFAIVSIAQFRRGRLTQHTLVPHPPAVRLLRTLLNRTRRVAIVPIQIMNITLRVHTRNFSTNINILHRISPIVQNRNYAYRASNQLDRRQQHN